MREILESEKEAFFRRFSVPRETKAKLLRYVALLFEWNAKFNLVAESSLPHVWSRHILDSYQLLDHVPVGAQTLADLGSGAGFPGMVLAIAGVPDVHLIESIGKKAAFLNAVKEGLRLENVTVHQARIEALKNMRFDVITARALKALPELLALAKPLMHKRSVCLFLKGQNADAELTEARKYWTFSCEKTPSISDPSGAVLTLSDLKALKPHVHRPSKK